MDVRTLDSQPRVLRVPLKEVVRPGFERVVTGEGEPAPPSPCKPWHGPQTPLLCLCGLVAPATASCTVRGMHGGGGHFAWHAACRTRAAHRGGTCALPASPNPLPPALSCRHAQQQDGGKGQPEDQVGGFASGRQAAAQTWRPAASSPCRLCPWPCRAAGWRMPASTPAAHFPSAHCGLQV